MSGDRYLPGGLNPSIGGGADDYLREVPTRANYFAWMQDRVQSIESTNIFKGVFKFRAIVLERPPDPDGDASRGTRRYAFRIRIPELHSTIEDPCLALNEHAGSSADLPPEVRKAIELHPKAISADIVVPDSQSEQVGIMPRPSVGDVVWVEFEKGPSGGRIGGPIYVAMCDRAASLANSGNGTSNNLTVGVCTSLDALFAAAGGTTVAPSVGASAGGMDITLPAAPAFVPLSTSDAAAAATSYDEASIPNKSEHTWCLNELQPDFLPYVKKFIFECWNQHTMQIRLNSGYRDDEAQNRLRQEWIDGGREGIEPTAGLSYHSLGMAIDFNPTPLDRPMITSRDPASVWVNSGVVALAEECGLYWGGRFNGNYDPIHVDFRGRLAPSQRQTFVSAAIAADLAPNDHRLS